METRSRCKGAEAVWVQRCRRNMCRGAEVQVQRCRGAWQRGVQEVQRCRGADVQVQRCKGADVQVQMCKGAEEVQW